MTFTESNDHISFYVKCHSSENPLWFMLVHDNGRFYLQEEFEEREHIPFLAIKKLDEQRPQEIFSSREEGLKKALEIVKALRPLANTRDLEEEIQLYKYD